MWSIVSSYLLHILHIGSVQSFIILSWYDLVAKLLSCAAIIRPSVSAFSPVLLSIGLVLFWSICASWVLFGHLPWSTFSFHCFDNLCWALCFVFCFVLFAYTVVCSFPTFYRFGTSSSCLNFSPSFGWSTLWSYGSTNVWMPRVKNKNFGWAANRNQPQYRLKFVETITQ